MKRENAKKENKKLFEQFGAQEDFVSPKIIIEIMLVTYALIIGAAFGGALFVRFMDVAIYIYAFALLMIVAFDQKLKIKDLIYVTLFGFYCFSTTFFNGGGLGSVATIFIPLVLLCCFEYSNFGKFSKFIIKCSSLIYNVIFVIFSTILKNRTELDVGLLNPNTVCIMAIISFALWAIFADLNKKDEKILFLLLAVTSFFIIKNLQGRGALLSLLSLLFLYFVPKKILNKKVFIIVICTVFILSFIFPLIYLTLYNNGVNLSILGKNLYTGREDIWQKMIDAFSEKGILNILFGLGSKVELWVEHNLNVHHENYAIIVNFGIFGLIFYYAFIIKKLIKAFKFFDNDMVRKSLFFVFALIVLGFVESVSFWAVVYVFTSSAVGFTLALTNQIEEKKLKPLYKSVNGKFFNLTIKKDNNIDKIKLSILTPTYNRKETLKRAYNSLVAQTDYSFEWVVIDDGSTDGTENFINQIIKEEKNFKVIYKKQINGGKCSALNNGYNFISGDYALILDSDDYLTNDAVETIHKWLKEIDGLEGFAGVSGLRGWIDKNEPIGGWLKSEYIDATNLERNKFKLLGDKAEVYKTELLRKYLFPVFEGEKFMNEAYAWDNIALEGLKLRWYNKIIYKGEYLSSGLTQNINDEFYANNYRGYTCYVKLFIKSHGSLVSLYTIGRYKKVSKILNLSNKQICQNLGVNRMKLFFGGLIFSLKRIYNKILKR